MQHPLSSSQLTRGREHRWRHRRCLSARCHRCVLGRRAADGLHSLSGLFPGSRTTGHDAFGRPAAALQMPTQLAAPKSPGSTRSDETVRGRPGELLPQPLHRSRQERSMDFLDCSWHSPHHPAPVPHHILHRQGALSRLPQIRAQAPASRPRAARPAAGSVSPWRQRGSPIPVRPQCAAS